MAGGTVLDRRIWGIAWPATLSNISIPLLGLIDAAILGHLQDPRYLGAVAIGSALLSFLYWGFSFLRMGTTGLVARAEGAGDKMRSVLILAQSAILAILLATLVIALHPLWLRAGLALMSPQPQLQPLAHSYAAIRIISAPAVLVTYTVVGWFIGRQNTRWPLVIVVTTNACNVALDLLLVVGMGLHSDGAAAATVLAEYLGLAIALFALRRQLPAVPPGILRQQLQRIGDYQQLIRSNRHLFLRTVSLLFAFAFFTAMGDKLGGVVLAANTLMMQLVLFAAYGLDGVAFAAEGLGGARLGARDLAGFFTIARRCAWWSMLVATVMSLFFLAIKNPLITTLTDIEAVRQVMGQYHFWVVALPLVAAPSYVLDGIFIGAAETRYMMITMLLSVFLVYLPIWYFTREWGNHGLWLAFTCFNASRGASLFLCYRYLSNTGRWLPAQSRT